MPIGRKRSPKGANASRPKPMLMGMDTTAATRPPLISPRRFARQLRGKREKELSAASAASSRRLSTRGPSGASARRSLEARTNRVGAAQLVVELAHARHRGGDFANLRALLGAVDHAVQRDAALFRAHHHPGVARAR